MDQLTIDYSRLKRPVFVLVLTPLIVITYLGIIYFHPQNNQWLTDHSFSWANTLQFVFIDQIGIEFFTYFIVSLLVVIYSRVFKINVLVFSVKGVLVYQLRFLPLYLLVFFIFNPVTQTLRYWYHYFPVWDHEIYFSSYFYNIKLYLTYLLPVLLGGYTLLNFNLYFNYQNHVLQQKRKAINNLKIEVFDQEGKTVIDLASVVSFERIGRLYYVFTEDLQLKIKYKLKELESKLEGSMFYRINRAAIINLNYLKNYSYWEHDKYVLRLINGKEYIVSRERIKKLKKTSIYHESNDIHNEDSTF